jgi:hypothetical protein
MSRARMAIAEIRELNAAAPESEPSKARSAPGGKTGVMDIAAERTTLFTQVEQKLGLDLDEEVQYELARWLTVAATAKEQLLPKLLPEARVAVAALLQKKPKLQLARTIRYRMEKELLLNNGWLTRHLVRFTDGNSVVLVGLGVLLTSLLGFIVYLLMPWLMAQPYFRSLTLLGDKNTLLIAEAAFLGGVVSIISRLREFSKLRDFDPVFLFLNALLKPALGIILGMFAYTSLKAGAVPLDPELLSGERSVYLLWMVGFLSGFSERFTSDIISRGEGVLGAKKKA